LSGKVHALVLRSFGFAGSYHLQWGIYMSLVSVNEQTLFLGVDGGGSKCRVSLFAADDTLLGTGLSGPANPVYGVERALAAITEGARLAVSDAGLGIEQLKNIVAGVGLAGVHLPNILEAVNNWQHPFKEMVLTTDLHTACLGATRGGDGAVIVIGTGSCGYSIVDGHSQTLGAHGFLMGDKGSGAWIGLQAVKAVLIAGDELGPKTVLQDLIAEKFQCENLLLVEKLTAAPSRDFADMAGLVFRAADRGDAVARAILADGAGYINLVAKKLLDNKPPRLSLIGGVANLLVPWLDPAIVAQTTAPLAQPEQGAVFYARSQLLPGFAGTVHAQ